ncbi:MAG: N-acetylmuramoyl-L-alanine amidase [Sphingobacteriia bacterium]|nr:N-acetylmuramoyl-L-alanine amidase [Sphingobacteriia bacterium]
MNKRIFKTFYFLVVILVVKLSHASTITNIRWSDNNKQTRLVIETSELPHYSIEEKIKELNLYLDQGKVKNLNLKNNLNNHPNNIKNIYLSQKGKKTVINVKLRNSLNLKHFILEKKHNYPFYRIVIDFTPNNSLSSKNIINDNFNSKPIHKQKNIEKVELIKLPDSNSNIIKENKNQDIKAIKKPVHKPVILIDPGHGGKDAGTAGINSGVQEKNITLKYALALKKSLEAKKKYQVHVTRGKDEFLSLSKRVHKTKTLNADLFISIHADSHKDPKLRGLSIYTLSDKASDSEAATLAKNENEYEILTGIDFDEENEELSNLILDMIYQKKQNHAKLFAGIIVKELQKHIKLLNNSHRFANFKVLKSKHVPSVLIELGYLSNPEEEKLLMNEVYKRKIIISLASAIDHYFNNHQRIN